MNAEWMLHIESDKEDYKEKSECFTKSDLKERGWTETSIKNFLGEPDLTKPNPRYRKAAPMKLFLKERVYKAELADEFIDYMKKIAKRRQSMSDSVEHRRIELLEKTKRMCDAFTVDVEKISHRMIVKYAISSYNEFSLETEQFGRRADIHSDMDFLLRICENYIRHNLTNYDKELYELMEENYRKVGGKEASKAGYEIIKDKIEDAIYETYPDLWGNLRRTILKISEK